MHVDAGCTSQQTVDTLHGRCPFMLSPSVGWQTRDGKVRIEAAQPSSGNQVTAGGSVVQSFATQSVCYR
eukprot:scaffold472_cov188-Prasinococcus_capsulatus_cf.AAC.1